MIRYSTDPPPSPREVLPTMYDLPSEDPEEPGLPDEFHAFQPQLLRETFRTPAYPSEQIFIGTDLNLYYDARHTQWHKRPDWFVVLEVERSREIKELRLSYVIWQEAISPFLVVELLSPGTEAEDLGQTLRDVSQPPTKWQVYEQILRIPYYVVFDRYTNRLQAFGLLPVRYRELDVPDQRLWLEEVQLGLGVWVGRYQDVHGPWLRWYDVGGHWIPTLEEQADQERQRAEQERQRAEQERQRAEQERQRAERLAARLRELGMDPEQG